MTDYIPLPHGLSGTGVMNYNMKVMKNACK